MKSFLLLAATLAMSSSHSACVQVQRHGPIPAPYLAGSFRWGGQATAFWPVAPCDNRRAKRARGARRGRR